MKTRLGVVLGLALAARGSAAIQYFHWDKPHHGDRGNVTALDLTSRKVVWEASAGKSVNFVHETGAGVVVGNDEGEVVLLDKANGKVIWRCRLEKSAEIKTLIADTDDGFFVSSGDEFFWLVSREGKLLLRCSDSCLIPK
ncbi:MAG TPA: PQQ-binding-like beta-propeller repeat protein [Thermoanaerobaculia bacterium]|jgi:outer membrane protein assembly factor BamB|nr:PQQ-binding-like beta-propeller repeat protein [Thermoanaerobaculia bacterium]